MTATDKEVGIITQLAEGEEEKSAKEVGPQEVLNLSLYDRANPNNLYITTIDKETFFKLQARQNLRVEQFSNLSGFLQNMYNNCID